MFDNKQFVALHVGQRPDDIAFREEFMEEVHQVLERVLTKAKKAKRFPYKAEALLCIALGIEQLLAEALNNVTDVGFDNADYDTKPFYEELHALFLKHLHEASKHLHESN